MDREKSVETNVSELKDTASIVEFEQKNNDLVGRAPTSIRIPTNTMKQPMILTAFPQTTPPSTPFQVTQQVLKEEEKVEEGTEKVKDGIEQEEEGEAMVEEGEEQEEEQEGDQEQVGQDDEQEQVKQDEEQEEQTSDQEQAPEQDTDADNYTQQPRKSVRRNKLSCYHSFHIDFLPNNLHRNQNSQL